MGEQAALRTSINQSLALDRSPTNQGVEDTIPAVAPEKILLANSKAVVADFSSTSKIETDIKGAIRLCSIEQIVQECLNLLDDDAARISLEKTGFDIMNRRDIRKILGNVAINI